MAHEEDFKSIRRLRYPLPEVVEPTESVCIEVNVPNDIAYISAFWGQMFALTRWYAWAGDTDHTAKDVAAVWRDVYEAAQNSECEHVLVRTSPFNSCELQVSYDDGETWETKFDARPCAVTAINDVLGTQSDNGASHTQPGEQPGGTDPEPEQCFDLDLTVKANGMTLIPLAITSGWRLSLTNVKGAWNDGMIVHDWVCPNGHAFFFGACSPLVEATQPTDPVPTEPHMKLIIRLPDGTYDAIPLDGTEYVIPSGQPTGNTFLLSNDSDLSDNQGDVSLHLLACSPANIVRITYSSSGAITLGHGPSYAVLDSEFTIYSDPYPPGGSNYHVAWPIFDRCVKVQVISSDGWSASAGGFGVIWYRKDCGSGSYVQMNVADYANLEAWPDTLCIVEQQSLSATPFSITMKVIEWDCT